MKYLLVDIFYYLRREIMYHVSNVTEQAVLGNWHAQLNCYGLSKKSLFYVLNIIQ